MTTKSLTNKYVNTGRATSIVTQAALAVMTGGTSLLVTVPAVVFSGVMQGELTCFLEEGVGVEKCGYNQEIDQAISDIQRYSDNPESQTILQGMAASLSKTLVRPLAYVAITSAFAVDTIGYALKPFGSFALMFTKNADQNRRKFHKELPKFALTNSTRDAYMRIRAIAPTYNARATIRKNSLISAPIPKVKKSKVPSN